MSFWVRLIGSLMYNYSSVIIFIHIQDYRVVFLQYIDLGKSLIP